MTNLSNQQLYEKILLAIEDSGWQVETQIPSNSKPFTFRVYRDYEYVTLNVHIWNIGHGGKSRSADEYRIQIRPRSGENTLRIEPDAINLLLGWWNEGDVFVGLDIEIDNHKRPGKSASKQINIKTLRDAYQNGFATYDNKHGETIFAFQSDYFMDYATNLKALHSFGSSAEDFEILTRAIATPEQSEVEASTFERQSAIILVKRKIRDTTFRKRVLTAYGHKCAFCGIQLKLVEAAHILPVSTLGSDDTSNGIALCALHHKAYDRSFVTFDAEFNIKIDNTKLDNYRKSGLDGGYTNFKANLRNLIDLPPDKRDRPKVEFVTQANTIRGWDV